MKTDEGFENGTAEIFIITVIVISSIKVSNSKLNELNIEGLENAIYLLKLTDYKYEKHITKKICC